MNQAFLGELEHESQNNVKVFERLPADKFEWQPHEKSMSLMGLATHIAYTVGWTIPTLAQPELDIGKGDFQPQKFTDTQSLIDYHNENLKAAKEAIQNTSDAVFMENWKLLNNGQVIFEMPKAAVLRSMVFNHMYHHRGQLTVYLRLLDIPVPGVYGPSADEQ